MMNEEVNPISTTRIGLKFGLYSGIAISVYSILTLELGISEDGLVGMLEYVLLIAALHLGMRDYKKGNESYMTFGQGFGIGLIISTITGLIGGAVNSIYLYLKPEVLNKMKDLAMNTPDMQKLEAQELELANTMMNYMLSPGGFFLISVISYFIVGLILSLIVSAFNKNNPPLFD